LIVPFNVRLTVKPQDADNTASEKVTPSSRKVERIGAFAEATPRQASATAPIATSIKKRRITPLPSSPAGESLGRQPIVNALVK